MKFYSTNNPTLKYDLKQAVLQGLPEDNGLFMPDHIPVLPDAFFDAIDTLTFTEIALAVGENLLGDAIPEQDLKQIIEDAFTFQVPIIPVTDNIYCLELFHGPTLAFKDFGARFMARLIAYLLQEGEATPCILVATSGDTGSAVAQGFYQVPGIDVVILYPSGKVSEIQEKQLTTIGGNVTALEIAGTFDDCQQLVKSAFLDPDLKRKRNLTSANSINVARLIPQSFYYFEAYARLKHLQKPLVCSVPSGNFGNLMGGLLAKSMGLPISRFIASNNDNRVFYDYLISGQYQSKPSIRTISNAMDVGNPSNFQRIIDLFQGDHQQLSRVLTGFTFSDDQTSSVISEVWQRSGYMLDPHGAVAYLGLQEYLKLDPDVVGVFLGTAHPAKFIEVMQPLIPVEIEVPDRLAEAFEKEKKAIPLSSSFHDLKHYLLSDKQ